MQAVGGVGLFVVKIIDLLPSTLLLCQHVRCKAAQFIDAICHIMPKYDIWQLIY